MLSGEGDCRFRINLGGNPTPLHPLAGAEKGQSRGLMVLLLTSRFLVVS